MVVQVPEIGASRSIDPGFIASGAYACKAASKPDAPAAVVISPVIAEKAVAAQPAAAIVASAISNEKIEVQETVSDITAAKTTAITAEPVPQQNTAASAAEPQLILPGILYDAEEKMLFGPNGKGLLYIGFDYDMDQNVFYSSLNCWQKAFGYNDFYDAFAPLGAMFFDTRSIYFNYDGRDWMFKLWKGQYGITSGAEVGLYTKNAGASSQYRGVDEKDFVMMDLTVYRNDELYFTRDPQMHWWLSGFVLGDISTSADISLESTITFKDQAMADTFVAALGTKSDTADVSCAVNGTSVSLKW